MKFECEACGHLGEASAVIPKDGGVALVCAECGHEAILGAPTPPPEPEKEPKPEPEPPPETAVDPQVQTALRKALQPSVSKTAGPPLRVDPVATIERKGLRIERGEGDIRCPKCGFRQTVRQPCPQCGLDLRRAELGDGPWSRPPEGKEAEAAQLDAQWEKLLGGDMLDTDAREAFIQSASASGLLDRAARNFRFFAQDHPGTPQGDAATEALGRLVERMHAEFVTHSGGSTKALYEDRTRKARKVLYAVAALMCLGILLLAMAIFGPF